MNLSGFIIVNRHHAGRNVAVIASVLVISTVILMSRQGVADEPRYRVVLEDVPGADAVEAGNIEDGIKILERQLDHVGHEKIGEIWSTLCAAYIDNLALAQAERACNKAVEIDPTYHALNNRGVLRVYKGDLTGAREDFERVRPDDVDAFLEQLKTTNVRLIAAGNFELLLQLAEIRSRKGSRNRRVLSTAKIEDLNE